MANAWTDFLPRPRDVRHWVVGHRLSGLPPVTLTPALAAKWFIDESTLQWEFQRSRLRPPTPDFRRRLRDEVGEAVELFAERGWLADPTSYHQDPPPLGDQDVTLSDRRRGPWRFEHLSWESGYLPHADEPGRERWVGYERNHRAHAWVVRHHDDRPRPWLVCVNGYRTGDPVVDLSAFRVGHLHRDLGLNVAVAVLPLHGPRSQGRSGDRVMYGGVMNTVHMAAQAAFDVRRLISWTRAQGATGVGLSGISLGGFTVSLTAALADGLDAVVAGVPEADLLRGLRRIAEPWLPPFYEQWGLSWHPVQQLHRAVSPMAMPCRVPLDGRFIYAGLVDRWVRPGNVHALWEHWGECDICWYEGSHLSFPFESQVQRFVDRGLARRGLTAASVAARADVA